MSTTSEQGQQGGAARVPGEEPRGEGTSPARLALLIGSVVVLGLWASLPVLIVVLALIVMIFMHELGHYMTAKAAGMKVTEFFLGFGPRLWSFRRGETEYGVKAIPAGAYVRIIGMSNLEEIDPAEEPRTYRQQPYWRRMSVALAGSTMHFLMALVLIWVVLVGFGIPDSDRPTLEVAALTERAPAQAAGIELGDDIVSVDGQSFADFDELTEYLRARPGEEVEVVVERDGTEIPITVTLAETNPDGEEVGFLGVGPDYERVTEGPVAGAVEAVKMTGETMWLSVKGLGAFFSPDGLSGYYDTLTASTNEGDEADEQAGEPDDGNGRVISIYGATRLAADAAEENIGDLLAFLFAINIFVGVFNLVPLLPLDGGHVAIATYERIRSRKGRMYHADVAKLLPLTYAVVLLLIVVGITSLYLDVTDPINL